jgi:hypothetical protein
MPVHKVWRLARLGISARTPRARLHDVNCQVNIETSTLEHESSVLTMLYRRMI